jgi:beta-galactosidase GanA
MNLLSEKIPYGCTYSPLAFDEEAWGRDLELMSRAGMNLLRVGDIGTWDRLEATEGEVSLDAMQRFYSLAHQFHFGILLSTGSATPPLWVYHKYPDVRIKSNRGEDYPLGTSYHWACIHHPGYLQACESYITRLAAFAIRQPNHFGWQISNEIGFPFNPTRESGEVDLYCYCDHSKAAFINWLKQKYADLEALAKAWAWSTTYFHYKRWDEAFPPEALPKSWSSMTRWIDWRLFWQQAFADHVHWQHLLIKKNDPDHPTSANIFNFKSYDRFGTYTGLDQWKIAAGVDHIGYDLYPGSGNKLAARPEHLSIFLDHGRSVSQSARSDFWLHELESGPINGWLLGPDRNTDEKDISAYCIESLGHNGKLLLYMPWREWEFQALHWGALADLRGRPTRRFAAAKEIGEYLQKNSAFLRVAQAPRGDVAILESKANAIFLRGVGQEDELFEAQRGAYSAFWELGYSVDFITPELLLSEPLENYKFICLPLMGVLSTQAARALMQYVRSGGLLVGFARLGTLTERGWYQPDLPIPELGQAFGIKGIEADTLDGRTISMDGRTYQGWLNRDVLTLEHATEVLGSFEDGRPALTLAEFGKGYGLYIATQADGGLAKAGNPLLKDAIELVARRTNRAPNLTIDYPGKMKREIDPHILETPQRSEILLVSYLNHPVRVLINKVETNRTVESVYCGLLKDKELAFSQSNQTIHLALEIEPRGIGRVVIYWRGATSKTENERR